MDLHRADVTCQRIDPDRSDHQRCIAARRRNSDLDQLDLAAGREERDGVADRVFVVVVGARREGVDRGPVRQFDLAKQP